jgi:hypothetical protein
MDFDEDRSQARTAAGPRIMASLRLVITILRLAGAASIAPRCVTMHAGPATHYKRS